jgi:uncharacterized protein (TIGR00369 family)
MYKDLKNKDLINAVNERFRINAEIHPDRLNSRMNLKLVSCDWDNRTMEFSFIPDELSLNPYGQVHGGMACCVIDYAGGAGTFALTGALVSTIDLSVTYLKPMAAEKYIVKIEYTHIGSRVVNCTGRMIDGETGEIYVTSMVSYMLTVIDPEKGGRLSQGYADAKGLGMMERIGLRPE